MALMVCNAPFDPVSPVDEVNVNALPLLASSPPTFKYVPSAPLLISRSPLWLTEKVLSSLLFLILSALLVSVVCVLVARTIIPVEALSLTSNIADGSVNPIPTLPSSLIRNLSVVSIWTVNALAVCITNGSLPLSVAGVLRLNVRLLFDPISACTVNAVWFAASAWTVRVASTASVPMPTLPSDVMRSASISLEPAAFTPNKSAPEPLVASLIPLIQELTFVIPASVEYQDISPIGWFAATLPSRSLNTILLVGLPVTPSWSLLNSNCPVDVMRTLSTAFESDVWIVPKIKS